MIINWKIKSGLNIFFQKLTPTPQPSHEFTFYDDYLGCHVSDAGRSARVGAADLQVAGFWSAIGCDSNCFWINITSQKIMYLK